MLTLVSADLLNIFEVHVGSQMPSDEVSRTLVFVPQKQTGYLFRSNVTDLTYVLSGGVELCAGNYALHSNLSKKRKG